MLPFKAKKSYNTALQYAPLVLLLLFVSQLPLPSAYLNSLASFAVNNVASVVGMSVGVPRNETNALAQDLQNKEQQLNERERLIDVKEQEIRAVVVEENAKQDRLALMVIGGVTALLMFLIGINFYLDRRRSAQRQSEDKSLPKTGPHAHEGEFMTKL